MHAVVTAHRPKDRQGMGADMKSPVKPMAYEVVKFLDCSTSSDGKTRAGSSLWRATAHSNRQLRAWVGRVRPGEYLSVEPLWGPAI